MVKLDKLTLIMILAIVLAIVVPTQSLVTIQKIVSENNKLIINETIQNRILNHRDTLQRAAEHENISKFVQEVEANERVDRHRISSILMNQSNAVLADHEMLMSHLGLNETKALKKVLP